MSHPHRIFAASLLLVTVGLYADDAQTKDKKSPPVIRVVTIGDSTVAHGGGWGDAFGSRFGSNVEFINLARSGSSSKSFRTIGQWQKALDAKPTWLLIQFGHNDQPGKGPERETDPETTYRENLAKFVDEVRAIGAKPVLVTSLTRRTFGKDGKIADDGLPKYAAAVRKLAKDKDVPLVDLHARSVEQCEKLGSKEADEFNAASKDPAKTDRTHLNEKGAEAAAQLVADEVAKVAPALAELFQPAAKK